MYNGNIINAVYSASTAGYSTTSEDIWGVSYPYLKRVKSEFDDKDPNWGIEAKYTKDEVKERIESQTDIKLSNDVKNWFKIDSAFSGKYISGVTIDGHTSCTYDGSESRITGITLCNLFDVKSNAMEIRTVCSLSSPMAGVTALECRSGALAIMPRLAIHTIRYLLTIM